MVKTKKNQTNVMIAVIVIAVIIVAFIAFNTGRSVGEAGRRIIEQTERPGRTTGNVGAPAQQQQAQSQTTGHLFQPCNADGSCIGSLVCQNNQCVSAGSTTSQPQAPPQSQTTGHLFQPCNADGSCIGPALTCYNREQCVAAAQSTVIKPTIINGHLRITGLAFPGTGDVRDYLCITSNGLVTRSNTPC